MIQLIVERVLAWIMFSAFFGLIPIGFVAQRLRREGEENWLTVAIGRGELLPMTAILCGSGIGQLVFYASDSFVIARILVFGFALAITILSSMHFGDLTASYRRPRLTNTRWNRDTSLTLFFLGIIAGTGCTILAELK